jgi:hypothetical protein
MPLSTWKVLLKRSDQIGYHYVTTLHRASEPTVSEDIQLIIDSQRVRGTVIEVHKEFSSRSGVSAFTVMADERELETD